MARVPTWTELRLDAMRLAKLQEECYKSVHLMLDSLPDMDRKIATLTGKRQQPIERQEPPKKDFIRQPVRFTQPESIGLELERSSSLVHTPVPDHGPVFMPDYEPISLREELQEGLQEEPNNYTATEYNNSTIQEKLPHSLEHLEPLPMPLSEYYKMNRPKFARDAELRAQLIKRRAEYRKQTASSRLINSFKKIRLSNRASANRCASCQTKSPPPTDIFAPNYLVKHALSEQEMKRRTAKFYRKLPEVREKRTEQITCHEKVQNYKNRLEYGKKLQENRRQGIINYPLRVICIDDKSLESCSSQGSSMAWSERSADASLNSGSYY